MKTARDDSARTAAQRAYVEPRLPQPHPGGRPPTDRRLVRKGLRDGFPGGIPWRLLPSNFPPWQTVYQVFRTGTLDPAWAALNAARHLCPRREEGRRDQPRTAGLGRQSVQSDGPGGAVGEAAGKRIKGRKRPLLVDPLGGLRGVGVTPASCPERAGGPAVRPRAADWFPRLRRLWGNT